MFLPTPGGKDPQTIGTPNSTTIARIRCELRARLEDRRYCHVMGVETIAITIADAAGVAREKAAAAALLHDICKNEPRPALERTLQGAKRYAPTAEDWAHPAVWHGLAAGEIAPEQFGVTDPEVLEAVAYHPTGDSKLGPVALVLFVADFIEPSRHWQGVEDIRRDILQRSLLDAARRVAELKLDHVRRKGKAVHSRTLAMTEWLAQVG